MKLYSASSSVVNADPTTSYTWPDTISGQTNKLPFMEFDLRDAGYKSITGIVVDKIEMVQQGN